MDDALHASVDHVVTVAGILLQVRTSVLTSCTLELFLHPF